MFLLPSVIDVRLQQLASSRDDVLAMMRDPNRLSEVLPTKERFNESVMIK